MAIPNHRTIPRNKSEPLSVKVLRICFVLDQDHWDEALELLSETEVREALRVGGMAELARVVAMTRDMELDDILEEKDD